MATKCDYCLDWHSGPTTQIELFSPGTEGITSVYQLKYTPPFRSTIRPPLEERPLGPGELDPVNQQLNQFVDELEGRGKTKAGTGDAGQNPSNSAMETMILVGGQLLDLILPQYIQADLRIRSLFLEIGIDEKLLDYPWELMHDGEEFLCLKHFVGRFVNAAKANIPGTRPLSGGLGASLGGLSVLVISVPRPLPRKNDKNEDVKYEALEAAEKETETIVDTLDKLDGVTLKLLQAKDATFNNVWQTLKQGTYQIIHFNGHAFFNDKEPRLSGLVLQDRNMTTGPIVNYVGKRPPTFCFINACETGKTGGWKDRHNVFGLARAFLDTGSYFLGSRWKLSDKAGATFAGKFYSSLIKEGRPLGEAILEARFDCKKNSDPEDLGWASYVYYGDPRLCFTRVQN